MNRQALTEALVEFDNHIFDFGKLESLATAARLVERLLPGDCLACMGTGEHPNDAPWPCPVCDGSGRVWDEGIVEAVSREFAMALGAYRSELTARAFVELCNAHARSVLSALVELLTEKAET